MAGLIGTKIGMTSIFGEGGAIIPCTVIQAGPCTVTQVKNNETDGYSAIQIGYQEVKAKKLSKPELGHLDKNKIKPNVINATIRKLSIYTFLRS